MTERRESLNLIQRAAMRLGPAAEVAAPTELATTVEPAMAAPTQLRPAPVPVSEPVLEPMTPPVARQPSPRRQPVAEAPRPRQKQGGGDVSSRVHIDMNRLRLAGMITPDNMSSALSNEFRGIKRQLLAKARNPDDGALERNLILVTSALPNEGKTFSSVNLAISLAAERDLHVLLIDGDVVRPSVGPLLGLPAGKGLISLLTDEEQQVSDVMLRCEQIPNLSIMLAGPSAMNSPELLASQRMAFILEDLAKRYHDRMIIIDAPPVLVSPESAVLAVRVHQLLMVVESEQTQRAQVQRALESVTGCPEISLILNKAPRWRQGNSRSYYYSA
jgi:receptor protein-tyrosine kinase